MPITLCRLVYLMCILTQCSLLGAAEIIVLKNVSLFSEVPIERSTKSLVAGPQGKGKALQIVVGSKPEQEWQAQTWIRLPRDINEGDTIVITFEARALEPATADVKTALGLSKAPFTPLIEQRVEFSRKWKPYEIVGKAGQKLASADGRFGFTFGAQAQTFEIANLEVKIKR